MENSEMRNSILEVARSVFSRYGFRKTTLEDIARALGKGKSSLYYYFKNKEELFVGVLEMEISMLRTEMLTIIDAKLTPLEKLRHYILKRMEMFHRLVNLYVTFQYEFTEGYAFIDKIRERYDQEEQAIISRILEEGAKQKVFVIKDNRLTAMAIIMAMKGFEFPWSKEKNSAKIESDLDSLLDVLFYGLMKRKK